MTRMPHSSKWQRILSRSYGEQKSDALISRAQSYYDHYCAEYLSEMVRVNWTSLRTRVFPGLSIYKTLLEQNVGQEIALAEIETLFRAAFCEKLIGGIRLLNFLPNPFFIIRPILRMMTRDGPIPGESEIVEDSINCFAVNIYRCIILDTLSKHHAEELTAYYCMTDDWLAEALPKVGWKRTQTLGRGDDYCDFRWCRTK